MNLPSDLAFAGVRALAGAIREKRASAGEVLEAHLGRIDRLDPALGALVRRDDERARQRARAADEALARGACWGPLHGVPFTLKDQHEVAGWASSMGMRGSERLAERDGIVAERLFAAGAILLGKTSMALNVQGLSELHGRVANPWDTARVAGGSSGGAAAAVAARLTPFDVGADATGSIRMPAHFCGTFGMRPTIGRIPAVDMGLRFPGLPRIDRGFGTAGPLARSAADLGLLLEVLCGPHPRDPDAPPVPYAPAPAVEPRALRLAFLPAIPGIPIARGLGRALEDTARRLEGCGARVEVRTPPVPFPEVLAAFRALARPRLAGASAGNAAPPGTALSTGPGSALDVHAALDERDRIVVALEAWLDGVDALLCPASIATAFPAGPLGSPVDVDGEPIASTVVDHPCLLATVTGSPAVVVPVGRDGHGLPFGAQLVGRRWHDAHLVAVAATVADVCGTLPPPPLATERRP